MRELEPVTKTLPNGATVTIMCYVKPTVPTAPEHKPGAISIWLRTGLHGQSFPRAVKVVERRGNWLHVIERDGTPHRVKPHNVISVRQARRWMFERQANETEEWAASEANEG